MIRWWPPRRFRPNGLAATQRPSSRWGGFVHSRHPPPLIRKAAHSTPTHNRAPACCAFCRLPYQSPANHNISSHLRKNVTRNNAHHCEPYSKTLLPLVYTFRWRLRNMIAEKKLIFGLLIRWRRSRCLKESMLYLHRQWHNATPTALFQQKRKGRTWHRDCLSKWWSAAPFKCVSFG